MAQTNNHKMALLIMLRELLQKTDEEHTLNAAELIRILEKYGYNADRRTIYSNVEILSDFGIDVQKKEDAPGYFIASREFELPELKLLVDAVQSSKFITRKKSEELIGKLMKLTNEQKATELNRSVYIRNRMKSGNEKVYYNVDDLHNAMNMDLQITFQYGEWNTAKRLIAKRDGKKYRVSPWALTWNDENYYLIAYDEIDGRIKHFRVDKMIRIELTEEPRSGREQFRDFDLAAFAKKTFGMYGGPDADVTLRCEKHLVGVLIDRFGDDIMIVPEGEDYIHVHVPVSVSPQFFGWVTGLGSGMEIVSPEHVRKEYLAFLQGVMKAYEQP
ncbi:MAG: WYL domain-containing protein [Eubacterium sp.]|nr:WYL domain-containing protein [Eubacterium sp.]